MASTDLSVCPSFRLGLRWKTALLTIAAAASPLFSQTTANSRVSSGKRERSVAVQTSVPLDIYGPGVLATDAYGNVYVAVGDGVFKIDPSGRRTRVAGTEGELAVLGRQRPGHPRRDQTSSAWPRMPLATSFLRTRVITREFANWMWRRG